MTKEAKKHPHEEHSKRPLTDEEIEARTVERTPTQRIGEDGQPLEPPPGHGGRPQVGEEDSK